MEKNLTKQFRKGERVILRDASSWKGSSFGASKASREFYLNTAGVVVSTSSGTPGSSTLVRLDGKNGRGQKEVGCCTWRWESLAQMHVADYIFVYGDGEIGL